MVESGIADKWNSVRNWNATVVNTNMAKNWKEFVRAPVPISATNSWLTSVIMDCTCALLLSLVVFSIERVVASLDCKDNKKLHLRTFVWRP